MQQATFVLNTTIPNLIEIHHVIWEMKPDSLQDILIIRLLLQFVRRKQQ
jgi:hypothetical protein